MPEDQVERHFYRKSPGRQYGYEYDPLRSRTPSQQNSTESASQASRSGSMLSQRPDLRRTRQLLRQQILANKNQSNPEEEGDFEESPSHPPISHGPPSRRERASRRSISPSRQLTESDLWEDEDIGDPLEPRLAYSSLYANSRSGIERYGQENPHFFDEAPPLRSRAPRISKVFPRQTRQIDELEELEEEDQALDEVPSKGQYQDDEYEYFGDVPPDLLEGTKDSKKKGKLSRRGLLIGTGVVVAGGAAIWGATQVAPKLPAVANNSEQAIQDAYNNGYKQGGIDIQKAYLTSLKTLEGFSIDGAINAARLTRVAYDVFVSPVIKFGSQLTANFLTSFLGAFKTARGWLAGAYQDNATLQATQKFMESWVDQVSNMPKQLDVITQTDLDGAQSYLRALQRKLDEDLKKLEQAPSASPTQQPSNTPASTPTTKPQ